MSTTAEYDNKLALGRFAKSVDVVTFEFENVPGDTAEFLAERKPVRPGPNALRIAQDRIKEKDFLRSIGVGTAPYQAVTSEEELRRAIETIGPRAILKTVRMGYDGKGQIGIRADSDLAAIWRGFGSIDGILEGFVEFACEVSVIIARSETGKTATYAPVENQHVQPHPRHDDRTGARQAGDRDARRGDRASHRRKARSGRALAVEMFVTHSGEVLVNELAPRPHNSGHWTIDACYTSQFEQLVRAICGLPLGSPERHSDAVMKNLIGADIEKWREAVNDPLQKIHLYGKDEALPGRKMGHRHEAYPAALKPFICGAARHRSNTQRIEPIDALLQLRDRQHFGEPPIEERLRRFHAVGAIVEPIERRRGIDAGEQPALRIEIEIGRAIAGRVPDRIDRVVEQLRAMRQVERRRKEAQRAPHRLAMRQQDLEPRQHARGDALADFHRADMPALRRGQVSGDRPNG